LIKNHKTGLFLDILQANYSPYASMHTMIQIWMILAYLRPFLSQFHGMTKHGI